MNITKILHSLSNTSVNIANLEGALSTQKLDIAYSKAQNFHQRMLDQIQNGGLLVLCGQQNVGKNLAPNVYTVYYDDYTIFRKKPVNNCENFYFTIQNALFWGNICLSFSEDSLLETQILLSFVLGIEKSCLYAFPEKKLTYAQEILFQELLDQRKLRVPIDYLLGDAGFMSLSFQVTPDVLIPRPETEFIVEYVTQNYKNKSFCGLDLATGSGCIAISILHYLPDCFFIASDISLKALKVAQKNARLNHVDKRISFINADLLSPFKETTFDVIVSNPPYVSLSEYENIQPELKYEPQIALTDNGDGYHFYELIVKNAARYLKPGGELILELGFGQLARVQSFIPKELLSLKIIKDYSGIDRVLVLRK